MTTIKYGISDYEMSECVHSTSVVRHPKDTKCPLCHWLLNYENLEEAYEDLREWLKRHAKATKRSLREVQYLLDREEDAP